jgi:hypothetical protein
MKGVQPGYRVSTSLPQKPHSRYALRLVFDTVYTVCKATIPFVSTLDPL